MKTLAVDQGSIEWMTARLGLPTCSQFDRLVTPKTMKPSAGVEKYGSELLTEWQLGCPLEWGTSEWMERGKKEEEDARRWYEMDRGVDVRQVGLVLRDDGEVAGSPDGLIGEDGGLEIKVLGAKHHGYFKHGVEDLAMAYVGQVQGYLYLTGRKWWDLLAYHPHLRSVAVRIEPDPAYLAVLLPALDGLVAKLKEGRIEWAEDRVPRPWQEDPTP